MNKKSSFSKEEQKTIEKFFGKNNSGQFRFIIDESFSTMRIPHKWESIPESQGNQYVCNFSKDKPDIPIQRESFLYRIWKFLRKPIWITKK